MTDDKGNGDGAGDDKATAKLTTADKELTTADKELLRAATSGDLTGLVALTPERLQEMSDALRERTADINTRYPKLVEECPYETRLGGGVGVQGDRRSRAGRRHLPFSDLRATGFRPGCASSPP